jgi:hypothetical protein
MKKRLETVLLATAGQDDERQGQGEHRIFHAGLELNGAVHVQVAEHLLPENCFRSTANFSHGLNTDETRIFSTLISRINANFLSKVAR